MKCYEYHIYTQFHFTLNINASGLFNTRFTIHCIQSIQSLHCNIKTALLALPWLQKLYCNKKSHNIHCRECKKADKSRIAPLISSLIAPYNLIRHTSRQYSLQLNVIVTVPAESQMQIQSDMIPVFEYLDTPICVQSSTVEAYPA